MLSEPLCEREMTGCLHPKPCYQTHTIAACNLPRSHPVHQWGSGVYDHAFEPGEELAHA